MLDRPCAGILQMNSQPSAQNNREAGCGPALPGFRNWTNPEHVRELADLWNVYIDIIPHWSPPTHAMQLFRYPVSKQPEFRVSAVTFERLRKGDGPAAAPDGTASASVESIRAAE